MTQALLLMDIQNALVGRVAPDPDAFLDTVVAAQERAEQAGIPVVLVRVGFTPGHPEISARNKGFAPYKGSGLIELGDESTEPHERLLRGNGDIVVTKKRVSAFAGSDLELVLRSHDVTHLVLGGISTSGVVLSTVREAADRDYEITVLADLCFDPDEEVHQVLLHKIFPRQCEVIDSPDWAQPS